VVGRALHAVSVVQGTGFWFVYQSAAGQTSNRVSQPWSVPHWSAPTTQRTSSRSLAVTPQQPQEPRSRCFCAVPRLDLHPGDGGCSDGRGRLQQAAPTSSMASSPLSPDSPRTASPLPSEDAVRPHSPSPDDAVPARGAGAPPADEAGTQAPPKGKEKAAPGPLKLLDLPVDVLKEIIHQVRVGAGASRGCCAPPPPARVQPG
jgi:hypothetical protein